MAGRRSKRKGSSAEREFAKLIGGRRTPLSGSVSGFKGDVKGLGLTWEVKRRREAFSRIYGWLEEEGIDALAIRADRKPWLVVMELDTFLKLLGQAEKRMEKKEEGEESENNGSSHWMEKCPKSGEPCTCKNECVYLRQKRIEEKRRLE